MAATAAWRRTPVGGEHRISAVAAMGSSYGKPESVRLDPGPCLRQIGPSRTIGPAGSMHNTMAGSHEEARAQGPEDRQFRHRLEQRLAFEHLIAALSTEFINARPDRLDALIEQCLGRIGTLFEVDRAYLFCFARERKAMSNTHEWVAEGISPESHNLQDVPFSTFPWLMRELTAGRDVHVPDTAALPDEAAGERAEFLREGIRSLALVPYGNASEPEGFIGFDSVRRQRWWPPEIMLGLRLVGQMIFNAFRAREMAESLSHLAFHDALTGLGNRRLLRDRLEQMIVRARRLGSVVAVVLVDLDDFKLVNDSFGHSLGDELLKAVAARLSAALRETDTIARLGGDEFVVLAEVGGNEHLAQLVERLFEALAHPVDVGGMALTARMSVGIALFPADGDDAEALLREADTAMYSAKNEGKNRFAFFTEDMTRASRAALQLRQDLREALELAQIVAHYQPRVALPSRRLVGFEALARWYHPVHGLMMPDDFLPLAEQTGLVGEVDLIVLTQVLERLPGWRAVVPDCCVSMHVSARDLHDPLLIERMEALLREAGPAAAGLEIEVTEASLITDPELAAAALQRLRAAAPGITVAIDDFGSGWSSLAYLGKLPVSTLKLDRGFTADLGGERRNARAIVRSIIELARNLELRLVVEGVETEREAEMVQALGCVEAQGYLFSPALTPELAAELAHRRTNV